MSRLLCVAGLVLVLAGCQVAPEAVPLSPLREGPDARSYTYAELLTRAREHAKVANEASYVDQWGLLEDAARCLEQDARLMPSSVDRPAKFKPDQLQGLSRDLADGAVKLREAARTKDANAATAALRLVNVKVREMKLGE
jgi:hypothetical protein